jgi:hypothetical protein
MTCSTCAKIRAHTPQAIRRRLEILEQMMARKRTPAISMSYNVAKPQAPTGAPAASSGKLREGDSSIRTQAEALPPVGAAR